MAIEAHVALARNIRAGPIAQQPEPVPPQNPDIPLASNAILCRSLQATATIPVNTPKPPAPNG